MPISALAYLGGAAIGGGLGGLGSYLSAQAQQKAQKEQRKWEEQQSAARRQRATSELQGYGYTPYAADYQPYQMTAYTSPLTEQTQSVLSQYLTGQLSPAQEQLLAQQRRLGEEGIARTAAGRGMPGGAQAALATQLGRDIGLGAAQMAQAQQQYALGALPGYETMWERRFLAPQEVAREEQRTAYQYGLADYLRQQEAQARAKELMAQYQSI